MYCKICYNVNIVIYWMGVKLFVWVYIYFIVILELVCIYMYFVICIIVFCGLEICLIFYLVLNFFYKIFLCLCRDYILLCFVKDKCEIDELFVGVLYYRWYEIELYW